MKTIFYSKDAQFELEDDEYNKALVAWDNGKRCFISRLNVSLSPLYIWAGEKPNDNERTLNDGRKIFKKFNQWYLVNNPDVMIDTNYYPELKEKQKEQLYLDENNSKFSKEIDIKHIPDALS